MENDWAEDLGSKPKLCILNSVCVNGFDGRCWKVREKNHRRVLMMLRGGTAPFQIETGRWKGVLREERVCRECGMNEEIEDCNHWLLWCPRWDSEREHLLTSVEERLPNFALLTDDIQSATITDLPCGDHEIAWLIYSMWTARFG